MNSVLRFCFYLSPLAFAACWGEKTAGGSTDVETGGLAGVALQAQDHTPAAGARILLQRMDLNDWDQRPAPDTTQSDSLGHFQFSQLPTGQYTLEVLHPGQGTRAVRRIQIQQEIVHIDTVDLHTPGTLLISPTNGIQSAWIEGFQRPLHPVANALRLDSIPAGSPLQLRLRLQTRDTLISIPALLPRDTLKIQLP
jgi:hypothetical protein